MEAYFCVIFKLDRFQAAIHRLSSTADHPSPYKDDDKIGFSLRFHTMICRLSSTTGRASLHEYDDGIGFHNYSSNPPPASEGEDVEKSVGTFEMEEVKTTLS